MFGVLYIPDFPLQAVLRSEPGALARAAALFSNTKKSLVLAINAPARHSGVEIGMTAPQAVARCPTLLIRAPKEAAEAEAHAAIIAVGFTLSPLIEDTAPGVCTIDLKGTDPCRNERAATIAVGQLQALGFHATAGIGPTPLLALYAARAVDVRINGGGPSLCSASQRTPAGNEPAAASGPVEDLLAELAAPYESDGGQQDGVVLTVTDSTAFLAPLPLSAADPPPEMAALLARWGLHTLGDLTAISRDGIGRRFGSEGLALWDRARGGAFRPLCPVSIPQEFSATMDFEDEIETLEPLLFILRRFLERMALELRTSSFAVETLELTLLLADDTRHERSFRLPDPTADLEILFRVLQTYLESLRTEACVVGVRLRALPARPPIRQQGLFDTGLRDPHGFAETLARIVATVGSDRIGTPKFVDTHRPDVFTLVPPAPVITPAAPPPLHPATGLPLHRYRPPLPAQLELTNGRPTYLWSERFQGAVIHVYGPWLSSGEWWQADRVWHRADYDITLSNGGIYRLLLIDDRWFVEGEYD